MTDRQELIDNIDAQTTDNPNALAEDLDASLTALAEQVDLSDDAMGMGVSPDMAFQFLKPMIRDKATDDPDAVLSTLARLHLESGALLAEHSSVDPVDLL